MISLLVLFIAIVVCQDTTTTVPATTAPATTEALLESATTTTEEPSTTTAAAVATTTTKAQQTNAPTNAATTNAPTNAPTNAATLPESEGSDGCSRVVSDNGVCQAPQGLLQHTQFSQQCRYVDDGQLPLGVAAQECMAGLGVAERLACREAVTAFSCALLCQPCVDRNTVYATRVCDPVCVQLEQGCGQCTEEVLKTYGGSTICAPTTTLCADLLNASESEQSDGTTVPGAIAVPYSQGVLLPALLIGLGVGLPCCIILLLILKLNSRERIEPHGEEELGPSHWVGTVQPTAEAVAAADAAFEAGREDEGDIADTSSLDFESESDSSEEDSYEYESEDSPPPVKKSSKKDKKKQSTPAKKGSKSTKSKASAKTTTAKTTPKTTKKTASKPKSTKKSSKK